MKVDLSGVSTGRFGSEPHRSAPPRSDDTVATVPSLKSELDRVMDSTATKVYTTCPREFYYSMVEHRRPKGNKAALSFGRAWHRCMELHYKTDGNEQRVLENAVMTWEGSDSTEDYRSLNRLLLDYKKYAKTYGKPSQERDGRTVGSLQEQPLVEISLNVASEQMSYPYGGKLDRIIESDGLCYVEDHKTTSRMDKYYFQQFELSPQMMGYVWMAQQILPDMKIVGVRINVSHILTAKTEFHRQLVTFSKDRIAEWAHNHNATVRRIQQDFELLRAERAVDPETFPGDGKSSAFPGHYGDNGCSRKFGACQFAGVCSLAPRVRRQVLELDYEVSEWNPLTVED